MSGCVNTCARLKRVMERSIVRQHESTSPRCHVKILDKYLAVVSPDVKNAVYCMIQKFCSSFKNNKRLQ